jgi:hypothetical protein
MGEPGSHSPAAGAFAAFMSTASGLLVSIAGTVSHDVWPAAVSVPLAFGTMVLLSLRGRPARDVGGTMAALHVPERVPV